MKKIILSFLVLCQLTAFGQAQSDEIAVLEKQLNQVLSAQKTADRKLQNLVATSDKNTQNIRFLEQSEETLHQSIDSLKAVCNNLKAMDDSLKTTQTTDRTTVDGKLQEANNALASTQSDINDRTLWGGITAAVLLSVLLIAAWFLTRRIKRGTSSLDDVRKAQEALQKAHVRMQEEAVKLDNKMIELCERQMTASPAKTEARQTDHSLALKVADEIVRIEMNMSHMDASVKGYKQLLKAVQRIKDNFNANGYEIVDMLGKPYHAGMKVIANFVPDENLPFGSQKITGIIKPQINYNGQMIQAGQISVSQNI